MAKKYVSNVPSGKAGTKKRRKSYFGITDKQKNVDFAFLSILIVLVCFGMLMMFSASAASSLRIHNSSFTIFSKQLVAIVIGAVLMYVVSRMDYRIFERYAGFMMFVCLILLVIVAIPKFGTEVKGSRRWLDWGVMFQPSELMKPVLAIFMAKLVQQRSYDVSTFKGTVKLFFWVALVGVLMFLEPHVSGAMVLCCIAAVIMICAGVKLRYFIIGAAVTIPFGVIYVLNDAVRKSRLIVAFNPFKDKVGTGYQTVQSIYAIASGGLFGRGLGQSVQKVAYLPEAYNDFIFSVICEEMGLVGAILVVALFAMLIYRGITIALNSKDDFGQLLVIGIMTHIAVQTVINIFVTIAWFPNTGMTLPFFSCGGSALTVLMVEMGLVLSVSRGKRENKLK